MGEAAWSIADQEGSGPERGERSGPDFDLVRRLLLPPGWLGPRPYRLPLPDEMEAEEADDLVAQLEAENKVMKAVLRSEREAAAELRAQVAALTTQQAQDEDTQEDLRADRDRWATLVERLLFAAR
ncbi:hypothetical protein FF100_22255 [Methylobacterium terricola]|uniref:Uncharacterized protein n=1 Tax=Methylobacterium terricola TaxID=2583531 RepID=A0A5C4LE99_9HYPH|nr:hypothetical protein [Methylobacterium terricola]TNC10876.1 hypothetical protein FF100_22255 [Methylobacterium terricola]